MQHPTICSNSDQREERKTFRKLVNYSMCKKKNTNQHTRVLHKRFCSIMLVSHFNTEQMLIFILSELDNIALLDAVAFT